MNHLLRVAAGLAVGAALMTALNSAVTSAVSWGLPLQSPPDDAKVLVIALVLGWAAGAVIAAAIAGRISSCMEVAIALGAAVLGVAAQWALPDSLAEEIKTLVLTLPLLALAAAGGALAFFFRRADLRQELFRSDFR